jgi:hypothetical protein
MVVDRSWLERYTEGCCHVLDGRRAVKQQRKRVAKQKAQGRDTTFSEDLLVSFELTQVIFEDDLQQIRREFGLS